MTATAAAPALTVHLINRRMCYGHVETRLTGYSGKTYGKTASRFSPVYGCHVVELTPEEYEACRKDVFAAAHQTTRIWEPVLVESGERRAETGKEEAAALPGPVREFLEGYNLGMDGQALPAASSRAKHAGHLAATEGDPAHFEEQEASRIPNDTGERRPESGEKEAPAVIATSQGLKPDPAPPDVSKMEAGAPTTAVYPQPTLEAIDGKTTFPSLRRIAKAEGVDPEGKLKNSAALRIAIEKAREVRA